MDTSVVSARRGKGPRTIGEGFLKHGVGKSACFILGGGPYGGCTFPPRTAGQGGGHHRATAELHIDVGAPVAERCDRPIEGFLRSSRASAPDRGRRARNACNTLSEGQSLNRRFATPS